jgi:hypothetical protein
MKTFDEYKEFLVNYLGEEDQEAEVASMKVALSIPTSLKWVDRVLDENVPSWNEVAFLYRNMDRYDIDNIDYDDVINIGTLALISSDLHRIDEGETPLTEL